MFFKYEHLREQEGITTRQVIDWCEENLTDGKVIVGSVVIFIETEIDATAFKLRWL